MLKFPGHRWLVRCCSERCLSLSCQSQAKVSHYDALGITPKATQAEIKAAYYRLSKICHPDKNVDAEAEIKFRSITEAYEVLGNIKTKRLYDRGISLGIQVNRDEYDKTPEDPMAKFYESRERRTKIPKEGKTPIYDFDEWTSSHYGAMFEKSRKVVQKKETSRVREEKFRLVTTNQLVMYAMIATVISIYGMSAILQDDKDVVVTKKTAS